MREVVLVAGVQRHQGVAQRERVRTGRHLQLLREHPLHGGEGAQPGRPVATAQGGPQQLQVRGLVDGVDPQQRLPPPRRGQQLDHQGPMTLAVLVEPLLHRVGNEDGWLARDQPGAGGRVGRELVQRSAGGRLELDGVDPERVSDRQGDDVVAQLEDPRTGTEGLAREVRRLVEPRQGLLQATSGHRGRPRARGAAGHPG